MHVEHNPVDLNELRLVTLLNAVRVASEWMLRASAPAAEDDPERSMALLRASQSLRVVIGRARGVRGTTDARFREVLASLEVVLCELRERGLADGPASGASVAADLIDPIVRDAARAPKWLRRYRGPDAA
jgi:hypothetical protein